MALVLAETFHKYVVAAAATDMAAANDDLASNAWSVSNWGISANGRFASSRVGIADSGTRTNRIRLGGFGISGTTLIVECSVRWDQVDAEAATNNAAPLIVITNTTATQFHACVGIVGGILTLHRQISFTDARDLNTSQIAVGNQRMSSGVWHRVQFKVDLVNSGDATLKLDGVTIATASAQDFSHNTSATIDGIVLYGNQDNTYFEDLIVMDGSGAAFNDFKGDMRLELALPDANGATVQWTPTAGSNFQTIDDALPLAAAAYDTDYISEATTDEVNLSSHAAITASGATTIHFAQLEVLGRADAAGDEVGLRVVSGATTDTGADMPLINGTYRWRRKHWTVDPNTSAAWTVANINAAEWGVIKRV